MNASSELRIHKEIQPTFSSILCCQSMLFGRLKEVNQLPTLKFSTHDQFIETHYYQKLEAENSRGEIGVQRGIRVHKGANVYITHD